MDVLFPSDLEAKIAKAIKEKDIVAIHTSGVTEMDMDDFEPDFEVLSIDIRGITFYPRDDFSRIGFSVEQGVAYQKREGYCATSDANPGTCPLQRRDTASVMHVFASVSITRLKMEMEPGVQVESPKTDS